MAKSKGELRMEYTKSDLRQVKRDYHNNFVKIMKCELGSDEHIKLVKEECRLNRLEIRIQKVLGVYISDPCPLSSVGVYCKDCKGRYKKIFTGLGKNDKKLYRTIQVKQGGIVCNLKNIKPLGGYCGD